MQQYHNLKSGKIIVSDSINNLQQERSLNQVEVCLSQNYDSSELSSILAEIHFISDVQVNNRQLSFTSNNICYSDLVGFLFNHEIIFDDMKIKLPSLEDIYLEVIDGYDC